MIGTCWYKLSSSSVPFLCCWRPNRDSLQVLQPSRFGSHMQLRVHWSLALGWCPMVPHGASSLNIPQWSMDQDGPRWAEFKTFCSLVRWYEMIDYWKYSTCYGPGLFQQASAHEPKCDIWNCQVDKDIKSHEPRNQHSPLSRLILYFVLFCTIVSFLQHARLKIIYETSLHAHIF